MLSAVKKSGFADRPIENMYASFADAGIIKYIEDFAANNPYGITLSEAHAIYGYTTNLFYEKLNIAMGIGAAKSGSDLIALIESGLKKLPNAKSTQFMGMDKLRASPIEGKTLGDVVTFKPFQSASNPPTKEFWDNAFMKATVINSQAKDISALVFFVKHADRINPSFKSCGQQETQQQ